MVVLASTTPQNRGRRRHPPSPLALLSRACLQGACLQGAWPFQASERAQSLRQLAATRMQAQASPTPQLTPHMTQLSHRAQRLGC